ncbi:peptidoglycan-binding protein, partial [Escherichia coli]|nr:peptidoglycan-binding protein [Escherichia coli]
VAPNKVPALPGLDIRWDHGDLARSKAVAQAMCDLFQIAFEPSLTSRHIEGRAIDMTIGWNGTIKVKDRQGKAREVGAPRSGDTNPDLHRIGAGYGVIK